MDDNKRKLLEAKHADTIEDLIALSDALGFQLAILEFFKSKKGETDMKIHSTLALPGIYSAIEENKHVRNAIIASVEGSGTFLTDLMNSMKDKSSTRRILVQLVQGLKDRNEKGRCASLRRKDGERTMETNRMNEKQLLTTLQHYKEQGSKLYRSMDEWLVGQGHNFDTATLSPQKYKKAVAKRCGIQGIFDGSKTRKPTDGRLAANISATVKAQHADQLAAFRASAKQKKTLSFGVEEQEREAGDFDLGDEGGEAEDGGSQWGGREGERFPDAAAVVEEEVLTDDQVEEDMNLSLTAQRGGGGHWSPSQSHHQQKTHGGFAH